jgi:broad specificity phosphatase PhoE
MKPITCSEELREHNPGIASGMTREEAAKHLLDMTEPYIDSKTYPGAETFREFYHRVTGFMDRLNEAEEQVIIVSHGGTIHNIVRWWIGTPVTDFFKFGFVVANTGITVLAHNRHGQRVIQRLYDTAHFSSIGLDNPIE